MSDRAGYWQRLLAEWAGSGLSQAEFCRRRGVKAVTLAWWKRRLRGSGDRNGECIGRGAKVATRGGAAFVEVALAEVLAVNAVMIADQETRRLVVGEGLHDLLRGPTRGGIRSHVEVHHLRSVVAQHDEAVQQAETYGCDDEEVDRDDVRHVVFKERAPGLRGRLATALHVLCHRRVNHRVTEQGQLIPSLV
jgi:hypothetical protein